LPVAAPDEHQAGLMRTVKAVERAAIEAALTGSRTAALRALALHPLVDSAQAASRILDAVWAEGEG
jgi:6-phospho-beta-glucosidase